MKDEPNNKHPLKVASKAVKSLLSALRPSSEQERQFGNALEVLRRHEKLSQSTMEQEAILLYESWAERFELLKREFNSAWELFSEIERSVPGWYCVSPALAPWKAVSSVKGGYTFSACIMKNHHRNAPLSEKSLTVTFGLDSLSPGIGDERLLGRTGDLDDNLWGYDNCTGLSLKQKNAAAVTLWKRMQNEHIVFRLNHKNLGQQSTYLPISILERYSLRDLCQRLFILLNKDQLFDLGKQLNSPETLMLTSEIPAAPPRSAVS